MTLVEKGVPYTLEEVDILSGAHQKDDFLKKCPFAKVPAFEHDGFLLYETAPTLRYIDETFGGPSLQPDDTRARARMGQIMGIVDSYAYPAMIGTIVIQRVVNPLVGASTDEAVIAEAVPLANTSIAVLDSLIADQEFAAGAALSLADLHLVPVVDYFAKTPEGETALAQAPNLSRWWAAIKERPSVVDTTPQLG